MQISLGVLRIIAYSFLQDSSFVSFSSNLRSFTLKGLALLPLKTMTEPLLISTLKSKNSERIISSQYQLAWFSLILRIYSVDPWRFQHNVFGSKGKGNNLSCSLHSPRMARCGITLILLKLSFLS